MTNISEMLLKPNMDTLSSSAQRLKRNVLVSSLISIAICSQEVILGKNFAFAGYKFEGLSLEALHISLLSIVLYLTIDYWFTTKAHLMENRIRLTGFNVAKPSATPNRGNGKYDPITTDERQTSIYSWWSEQINTLEHYKEVLDKISPELAKESKENQESFLRNASAAVNQIRERADVIGVLVERFDESFWKHTRAQYLRFLFFDFLVPILLGLTSIIMCAMKVCSDLQ